MPLFTTFYSYKGGVGRTLALANVAWLLANHKTEPVRVLVIDFDLSAPGLHNVLRMPRKTSALGLIDYVLQYTSTATVPNIEQYIHKTAFNRIDIIPAGRLDRKYQQRLESVNWAALYENAHGFHLLEKLKQSITALPADYDYILIDSLTGFSDIGGICVQQLPDSLVLLFRLNQQNLDGIETVYKAASKRAGLTITPVITPAWPFIDQATDTWLKKTRAIFGKLRLHEISFDSGLSFGERVITQLAPNLTLIPKVLSDYQQLAAHLRNQNASDPLTLWDTLRHRLTTMTPEGAADAHLRLLKKRPTNLAYWEFLDRTVQRARRPRRAEASPTSALQRLMTYVNEQCEAGNKFALLGRAGVAFNASDGADVAASNDLTAALKLDGKFYEARLLRARLLLQDGKARMAVGDLVQCFNQLSSKDFRRKDVAGEIGTAALEYLDGTLALRYLQLSIDAGATDLEVLRAYVKACYLEGKYDLGFSTSERLLRLLSRDPLVPLLHAQLLAAAGRQSEALQVMSVQEKEMDGEDMANIAEAYLAVDPRKTLSLLRSRNVKIESPVRDMLRRLASLFLREEGAKEIREGKVMRPTQTISDRSTWNIFDVVAIISAKRRNGTLSLNGYRASAKLIHEASGAEIPA